MNTERSLLQASGLRKRYVGPDGPLEILREVELDLRPGELVAVGGPSGCGKSTLLFLLGGMLSPDAGSVRIDDVEIGGLDAERRAAFRAEHLGFVFQQFHLVPYLDVLDNVLVAALPLPGPSPRERAGELLDRLGLSGRVRHRPEALSSGEQQRTALARALLNRPRLILADEPTGNLDGDSAEAVLGHLEAFVADGGAVLVATHDDRVAGRAHRRLQLRDGRLDA